MSLAQVELMSGRQLALSNVRLSSTYAGLLEGYPCARMNDLMVTGLIRRAEGMFPALPVHVIEPVRTYPHPGERPGAFGPIEVLPAVGCIGAFSSAPVSSTCDPVLYRSDLIVVWFQAEPLALIGKDVLTSFQDIPWEELAKDGEL
jgi:hypothetical protein